jgi:hypothetical protein
MVVDVSEPVEEVGHTFGNVDEALLVVDWEEGVGIDNGA